MSVGLDVEDIAGLRAHTDPGGRVLGQGSRVDDDDHDTP